jgi:hypothetical protein
VLGLVTVVLWLAFLGVASLVESGAEPGPSSAATAAVTPAAAEVYVVRPGDTLWDIARRVAPEADPRPLVDELADRAGGAVLQSGQRIDVSGLAA